MKGKFPFRITEMPRLLKDLQINDVSSVDRGAGDGVKIVLVKRDFSADERKKDAASGKAMPGGGYPIENVGDLHNAIQAIGRAKDPAKTKAHIRARARALGASNLIPESWGKRDEDVLDLTGMLKGDDQQEHTMTPDEVKKLVNDAIENVTKDTNDKLAKMERENAFLKMSPEHQAFAKDMDDEGKAKFAAKSKDERDKEIDDCKKAAESKLDPEIRKRLDQADEDRKVLKALQEKAEIEDFRKRATDAGMTADQGEILRKVAKGDAAALTQLEGVIKETKQALAATQKTSGIFKEFGDARPSTGVTAYDQLMAKAAELRKVKPELSSAQAFAKVCDDPANAEIVQAEKAERYAKMGQAI